MSFRKAGSVGCSPIARRCRISCKANDMVQWIFAVKTLEENVRGYKQVAWIRFIPLLFAVVGVPLLLKIIPPNPYYGVRTEATLASVSVWYQANFWAGLVAVVFGLLAAGASVVIHRSASTPDNMKMFMIVSATVVVAGAMAVAGIIAS